jgi:hypothetical protein
MSIKNYPGLISGVTSRLPGDLERHSVTDAEIRHAAQFQPGSVTPGAVLASTARVQTVRIDNWMPAPLNQYTNKHWAVRKRAKDGDADVVALYCRTHGVTVATVKRRLRVLVVLPKGKRACDPDAIQKSLGDALVRYGALKIDSRFWVEWAPVEFVRGERLTTFLTLEEMT